MPSAVMLTPEASGDFCAFLIKGEVSHPRVKLVNHDSNSGDRSVLLQEVL